MSYTAKHWKSLSDFKVNNLNELELGVQEAHEDMDVLMKDLTNIKISNNSTIKDINDLLANSEGMVDALKELEKLVEEDTDISEFLTNYGKDYLTKSSQNLSKEELKVIYQNLKLVDAVQSLTPSVDYKQIQIHDESYTSHQDIRKELNDKASIAYVNMAISSINTPDNTSTDEHNIDGNAHPDIRDMINNIDLSSYAKIHHEHSQYSLTNHTHDGVYSLIHDHPYALENHSHNYPTFDYIDNLIQNLPTPDVSGPLNTHNNDATAHPDIWNAIENIDLSGYSKTDHTHNDYLPLTAGVDKKVTGSFHVDNYITIANGKGYRAYDSSGTIKELLRLSTGDTIILGDANSNLDIATHGTVRPSAGKSLNLGTSTYPWVNIYGTIIYQNGKQVANKEDIPDLSDFDLSEYSKTDHNHDGVYAPATHDHNYATQANIDTAISDFKTWLLGTGNTNTIDTIKDIIDIMDEHKDVLDALGNTYLPLTGGTINGNLTVSGQVLGNVIATNGDVQAGYLQTKSAGHETGTYDKIATLSSTGYIRYRTKAELKSDLGVPTDYATSSHTHTNYAHTSHTHDYFSYDSTNKILTITF